MLIVCPSCATSYNVDVASLQPNGRQVRCVRCRTVWHVEPSRADKLLAAAGAISPARYGIKDALRSFADELVPSQPAERPAAVESKADQSDQPGATAADRSLEPAADGFTTAPAAAEEGTAAPANPADVESPPIAPVDLDDGKPPIDVTADPASKHGDETHEDIETYAARHRRRPGLKRKPLRWPLSQLQNGIVALLMIDAVLVGWRNDVVRVLPQTASFYAMMGLGVNLRGLVFEGVTTTTEQREGLPVLVVEGNIVNVRSKIVDVPRIKFAARNAASEEIYSWTAAPPRATLPPGENAAFRTRFASPPPDVRDVLVRFVTRNDILSGSR
jgi:predicted Zn finger-like uncharacterized protein